MRIPRTVLVILLIAAFATLTFAQKLYQPKLTPQNSGVSELLITVSPVNSKVVWAAGTHGTFLLTTDGGKTWKSGIVKGAEWLQFRGVRGVSDTVAYLLSIGNAPTDFRIYKTEDAGATWTMQFKNELVGAFYDCFAFWTPTRGIAHSDSVNGVFPDLRTTDGMAWESIADNMPPALSGEFSFSSSDTCVATGRRQRLDCDRRRLHSTHSRHYRRRRYLECLRHSAVQFRQRRCVHRRFPQSLERHCGRRRP